jgi:hypothetical protein
MNRLKQLGSIATFSSLKMNIACKESKTIKIEKSQTEERRALKKFQFTGSVLQVLSLVQLPAPA